MTSTRPGPGSALPTEALGAVWTRTGRSFFGPELTAQLVERLRDVAERAGLFEELGTGWLLLDAELLPWSAKAADLLRHQYAAVGAAALAALPSAVGALEQAAARGVEVGELAVRTRSRLANAEAFRAAYRRYCWPTDGLDGVRLAPFQLLASEGRTFHEEPHAFHLALADRLVAAGPDLMTATRHRVVDLTDDASTRAGVDWWTELTEAGGEGMVVKPAANLTRTPKGRSSPDSRCGAGSTCGSSTDPTTPSRRTSSGYGTGGWGTSARWRSASTRSVWRRSIGSPGASRCGGCTSASSPCWRWSRSRSTRGCDLSAPRVAGGDVFTSAPSC